MPYRLRSKAGRLQALPRELRNRIWEYIVVPEESVDLMAFGTLSEKGEKYWLLEHQCRDRTASQLIVFSPGGVMYGTHEEYFAKARGLCRYIKDEVDEVFSSKAQFGITIPMYKDCMAGGKLYTFPEVPLHLLRFTRSLTFQVEVPVQFPSPFPAAGTAHFYYSGATTSVVVTLPNEKKEAELEYVKSLSDQTALFTSGSRHPVTSKHVKLQADYDKYITSELRKHLPRHTGNTAWLQDVLCRLRGNSFVDAPYKDLLKKEELFSAMTEYFHAAVTDALSSQETTT